MNTFTTTFKVQPNNGGLTILHFASEAKDRSIAEQRNMQKLFDELDEDFDIVSKNTKLGGQPHSSRSTYKESLVKDKRARY